MKQLLDRAILEHLRFLKKYHRIFLAVALLSLVVAFHFILKLEIKSGFEDLLPQNNKAVQVLKEIPKKVGGAKYVKIAITNNNIEATKRFADDFAAALLRDEEIQFVKYKFDNRFFKDRFMQYLAEKDLAEIRDRIAGRIDYEKRKNNPFLFSLEEETPPSLNFDDVEKRNEKKAQFKDEGYYITDDNEVLFILARPKGFASDVPYARDLLDDMRGIVAQVNPAKYDPSIKVHLLGAYYSNIVEYEALIDDVTSTALISLGLLLMLFYFYFRRFKPLIYIISAPVMGVIWTFAATYFMIGYINTQTAFLAAILLGLVVDFSIHLATRYYEERQQQQPIFYSLHMALRYTGIAVAISGVTTILAFVALIFSDFVGFWQFGLIASVGVTICIAANFTIFPALIFLLEKNEAVIDVPLVSKNLFNIFGTFIDRLKPSRKVQKGIVYTAVLLAIVSAALIPMINFEYDLRNLRTNIFVEEELTERLSEVTGRGTTPSVIYLTEGIDEVRDLTATLDEIKVRDDSTISQVRSVLNLIPDDVETKKALIEEIKGLVDSGEKYLKLANKSTKSIEELRYYLNQPIVNLNEVPEDFLREFRDTDGKLGSFVLVYPTSEQADMRGMIPHARQVRQVNGPSGKTYYGSGESVIFSDMLTLMSKDGKRAIMLAFFLIFLVVLVQTRSLKNTLVLLSPLYVGSLMICAFMVNFDIRLNFFNIIVYPLIIGIGVDNCIHLFARFVEAGYTNVRLVLKSVGRAVLLTSLTTIIGFSSLLYAHSMALNSMGVLAVAGVAFCWLTSMTLLPALMTLLYKDEKAKAEEMKRDAKPFVSVAERPQSRATTAP